MAIYNMSEFGLGRRQDWLWSPPDWVLAAAGWGYAAAGWALIEIFL